MRQREKVRHRPRAPAFRVGFRDRRMIAIVRAEDVEAGADAIAAERLRRERIRGVVRELNPRLRRKAHSRRSPTVFCSQCRSMLPVDLAAQQIQYRLPRVLVPIFIAIGAVIDVRELQRGALRQADTSTTAESGASIEVGPERLRTITPLIGESVLTSQ